MLQLPLGALASSRMSKAARLLSCRCHPRMQVSPKERTTKTPPIIRRKYGTPFSAVTVSRMLLAMVAALSFTMSYTELMRFGQLIDWMPTLFARLSKAVFAGTLLNCKITSLVVSIRPASRQV